MVKRKYLVVTGVPSIKKYVFGTDQLKEIRGASALLEDLTRYRIIEYLKKCPQLEIEPVFVGGGAGQFIIDAKEEDLNTHMKTLEDDIKKVRNEDLESQGYTAEVFSASEKDYKERIDFTNFSLVTTKLDKIAYIAQLHQMPTDVEFKKYSENGKEDDLPVRNILVLTLSNDGEKVIEVNFFGAWKDKQRFSLFSAIPDWSQNA